MRFCAIWYSASMKTSVTNPCISDVTDPAIISERTLVVKVLRSALQMLGCVVGRNTEVVLHNLTNPQKLNIGNREWTCFWTPSGQLCFSGAAK